MDSREPTVRGAVILGLRAWVGTQSGSSGEERLRAALGKSEATLLFESAVVNTTLVPASAFKSLSEQMIAHLGLEGPRGFHAAAGHVALGDLAGYMKVLLKFGSPSFLIHRFPRIFKHYFSHGGIEVVSESDGRAHVRVSGASAYGDGALEGTPGWIRAAITYSGAKGVRVVRRDAADKKSTDYVVTWS